jgi:hypothetical protein
MTTPKSQGEFQMARAWSAVPAVTKSTGQNGLTPLRLDFGSLCAETPVAHPTTRAK